MDSYLAELDTHALSIYKQQVVWNDHARNGIDLLFNDRFEDAATLFDAHRHESPVHAYGYAYVSYLKAIMTFEPGDIDTAKTNLKACEDLAASLSKQTSVPRGNFVARAMFSPTQTLPSVSFDIVQSDAQLLTGLLHFLSESIMDYMKGGLILRRSYKGYESSLQYLDVLNSERHLQAPEDIRGGVRFGVGLFRLLVSLLPPRVAKIMGVLGVTGDRDAGLADMSACYEGRGLKSPMASLMILHYHIVLTNYMIQAQHDAETPGRILAECQERYPHGGLYKWLAGRRERSAGNLALARARFQSAFDSAPWQQMKHMCAYELGWCCLLDSRYSEAAGWFKMLAAESAWSKAFYQYLQTLCVMHAGEHEEAVRLFKGIPGLVRKKGFGGKTIPVEEFVMRRSKSFMNSSHQDITRRLFFPLLEMIYFWNSFRQCTGSLAVRLSELATAGSRKLDTDERATLNVLQGAVYKALGRTQESQQFFSSAWELRKDVKKEKWTTPYALAEIGLLHFESREYDAARACFKKAHTKYSDYDFENRLQFRLQSGLTELKALGVLNVEDGSVYAEPSLGRVTPSFDPSPAASAASIDLDSMPGQAQSIPMSTTRYEVSQDDDEDEDEDIFFDAQQFTVVDYSVPPGDPRYGEHT